MARTRISTTVDAARLEQARRSLDVPDSTLMDRALAALLRELAGARERALLAEAPYEDDPELSWQAPPGPDLPYDGEVPEDVQRLAAQRRARYRQDRG